jgi:hypothetical protein
VDGVVPIRQLAQGGDETKLVEGRRPQLVHELANRRHHAA